MKIRPLNKRLIAKLYQEPEKVGKIIITSEPTVKDRFIVSEIDDNEQGIQKGDMILCDKYDALEKEIDNDKFYIIAVERVLAVIDKE